MSDHPTTNHQPDDDSTRSGDSTAPQRRPRALPRRGYENQPRPMTPPPPEPLTVEQQRQRQQQTRPPAEPSFRTTSPPSGGRSRGRRRATRGDSGLYLPWWSLLVLIIVAGVAAFGLLGFVMSLGSDPLGDQTPQVVIVTNPDDPTPFQNVGTGGELPPNTLLITVTPGGVPTSQIFAPSPVPQAEPTNTPAPGATTGCPLNAIVEVIDTEGVGLSIRSEPRQGDNILGVAIDFENMRIIGGPEYSTGVDGTQIEWCQIEGVDFPARPIGWAARSFLIEVTFEEE